MGWNHQLTSLILSIFQKKVLFKHIIAGCLWALVHVNGLISTICNLWVSLLSSTFKPKMIAREIALLGLVWKKTLWQWAKSMNPRACNTFGCLHLTCLQMVELKCCLKHHFWLLRFYEEVIQILGGKTSKDFFFQFSPRKLGVAHDLIWRVSISFPWVGSTTNY